MGEVTLTNMATQWRQLSRAVTSGEQRRPGVCGKGFAGRRVGEYRLGRLEQGKQAGESGASGRRAGDAAESQAEAQPFKAP